MSNSQKIITWQQYSKHITPQDCWVLVDGYLYDVSDYLVQHPGGDDILLKYSGIDATIPFTQQQHSAYAISLRDARRVGKIQTPIYTEEYRLMLQERKKKLKEAQKGPKRRKVIRENIPFDQIAKNNTQKSCWIVIQNKVYDVTNYMGSHPGGEGLLLQRGGKDATVAFHEANHSMGAIQKRQQFFIGTAVKSAREGSSNLMLVAFLIIALLVVGYFAVSLAGN